MVSAKEHYDSHRAPVYTWMSGGAAEPHDIVHARAGSEWRTTIGVYEKIGLAPAWVREQLGAASLAIVKETLQNGLATLVARRSNHS